MTYWIDYIVKLHSNTPLDSYNILSFHFCFFLQHEYFYKCNGVALKMISSRSGTQAQNQHIH